MPEIVCAFGWREFFEDDFEGIADGIERSWGHSSEEGFELGEDLFDGVKVGTVGRKIEQMHPGGFEALADACDFVRWQIVDDDDAAWLLT